MKRQITVISAITIVGLFLSACGAARSVRSGPAVCKSDSIGCALIKKGQTVKIGMGAPMTGDNAAFGTDISQAAIMALADAGTFQGFTFQLVAQDDGGTAEGGASVANKLVSDPTVVAIEGHQREIVDQQQAERAIGQQGPHAHGEQHGQQPVP